MCRAMVDVTIIFITLWSFEGLAALILNFLGIYFLVTEKKYKIMHFLLIHLSLVEMIFISIEVVYHSRALYVYGVASPSPGYRLEKTINLVLLVSQFMSVALLTFDRVLMVRLGLRYEILVTKQKLALVILIVWMISLLHIPYYWLTKATTIYLVWEVTLAVGVVISYVYILVSIYMSQRSLRGARQQMVSRRLKYRIPLLIVVSLLVFYILPELMLTLGEDNTEWFYLFWFLNYLCDPLIYMFGLPFIRLRVYSYWQGVLCNDRIEPTTAVFELRAI